MAWFSRPATMRNCTTVAWRACSTTGPDHVAVPLGQDGREGRRLRRQVRARGGHAEDLDRVPRDGGVLPRPGERILRQPRIPLALLREVDVHAAAHVQGDAVFRRRHEPDLQRRRRACRHRGHAGHQPLSSPRRLLVHLVVELQRLRPRRRLHEHRLALGLQVCEGAVHRAGDLRATSPPP